MTSALRDSSTFSSQRMSLKDCRICKSRHVGFCRFQCQWFLSEKKLLSEAQRENIELSDDVSLAEMLRKSEIYGGFLKKRIGAF